jgi:hypothetical protein
MRKEQRKETKAVAKVANTSLPIASNPWTEISTELDKHLGAPIVKFSKDGQFLLSDIDTVPIGTRCVARVDLVQFGWCKWSDGAPVDRRIGLAAERYRPPLRADLGDTDQTQWEVQPDGSKRDPWQFQAVLPITRLDTDETFTFTTGSKGGLNCVNKLVRVYGTRVAKEAAGLPVVELKADFYKHRTYGKIYYPVLNIVMWTDDGGGKPLSVSADLNDEVPY